MHTIRRTRLIDFIKPWAECHSRYRIRIGDAAVKFDCLTTDALEDLAQDICSDFWRRKRLAREHRARIAAVHFAEKMGYVVTDPYLEAAE